MPQDIKLWEIIKNDKLKEIDRARLNLEERLEEWLERDIGMVSNDLLVIGRQVKTDFGGLIDILCLDINGDIVIIELKRDKTPREITAQLLDYGSWVKELSNEKITEIADDYLGENGQLDKAFKEKFNTEIPEILNESHRMFIVASELDSSSERIIDYLSNSYGVGINAITFQYFKEKDKEFLSRVFLIEPTEAEYRAKTKSSSKRKPALTYEELEEIARGKGVGDLYQIGLQGLSKYFDQVVTTRSSVVFIGLMGKDKSRSTIFSILPGESSLKQGLKYRLYNDSIERFSTYFGINKEKALRFFPSYQKLVSSDIERDKNDDRGGGYFENESQFRKFLEKLKKIKK